MIQRCTNPNSINYKHYGGRGITVDPAWRDFRRFYADMGPRPQGCTLERVNNSAGYSKTNCEWRTHKDQSRNKSDNKLLTVRSKALCLSAWAKELAISHETIRFRLRRGWSAERALFTPLMHAQTRMSNKQSDTLKESITVAQQLKETT